jgi:hypothetical protein
MLAIHQVFRDAFGCAPQLVGSVSGDPGERVDAVATYYRNVLALLHSHHEGEDELVWPKLLERAPDETAMIGTMQAQHEGLVEALHEAERRLSEWAAQCDIERGAALAASLATLGVLCAGHFDEEERKVLPLAAEHITLDEWAELPKHGLRSFSGDAIWLVLGLLQEQMPPEAVAHMNAGMPEPVREMWLGAGQARFAEFVAGLRG